MAAGRALAGRLAVGFFLRAETMHGFYTYLSQNPGMNPHEPDFHRLSHGESFLEVGDWGLRETTFDDLELVNHWRSYLAEPMRYLRHVL